MRRGGGDRVTKGITARAGRARSGGGLFNRSKLLAVALCSYTLLYVIWQTQRWGGVDVFHPIGDLALLPLDLIAAMLAWHASRLDDDEEEPGGRKAWQRISLAYLCLFAGDAVWLICDVLLNLSPFPSWADVAFISQYLVMLWALLSFPKAPRSGAQRLAFGLDLGILVAAAAMFAWHLLLRPSVVMPNKTPMTVVLAIIYPVGDLVLVFGIMSTLARSRFDRSRRSLAMIAIGIVAMFGRDLAFAYESLQGVYQAGGWPDTLGMLARLAFCYGGLAQIGRSQQPAAALTRPGPERLVYLSVRSTPYVALLFGYGLLIYVSRDDLDPTQAGVMAGALLLTALVAMRQMLAQRETVGLMSESALRRSEARFQSLVQNSSDVVTIIDIDSTVRYQSPSGERVLGYRHEELLGRKFVDLLDPDHVQPSVAFLTRIGFRPRSSRSIEWKLRRSDGVWLNVETVATNLLDDPDVHGIVLNSRDISDRKALEKELKSQAFHDPLTGLANRSLFRERLEHALLRGRETGRRLAVLFVDLDNFKTINDSLGHAAGDEVLVTIATRLQRLVRPSDTVARFGGDEFVVLVEDLLHRDEATSLADRLLQVVRMPCMAAGKEVVMQGSVGIRIGMPYRDSVEELLRDADLAMYRAKNGGKNCYALFDPSMHTAALEKMELQGDLARAVERGEFVVYYQPSIDIESREIAGVEALVRWQHPNRGLVGPGEFINLSEETGLILPIGQWVLEEACKQMHAWHLAYPHLPTLKVSVNLSARQLKEPELVEDIARMLDETELEPRSLVTEITESLMMTNTDATIAKLKAIKALGVRLAVDDFGTGYSSLSYLQRFPFDIIKVDKSFVEQLGDEGGGSALAQAIVMLGKQLHMNTVAEGVERLSQLEHLHDLGCNEAQGFLFAEPLAPDGVAELLEQAETWHQLRGAKTPNGASREKAA